MVDTPLRPADADDKWKEVRASESAELSRANGAEEQLFDEMRWCHGCWQAVPAEGGSFGKSRSRFESQWFCNRCWQSWRFKRQEFGGLAGGDDEQGKSATRWRLKLGSTCCCSFKEAEAQGAAQFSLHCPCCQRPLEAQCTQVDLDAQAEPLTPVEAEATGRRAFVVCLWGESLEYVLGAAVLARSIEEQGSQGERVCLLTADVPERPHRALLEAVGWQLREVEHVSAVQSLFFGHMETSRFRYVFTKLRAMALTEFDQILMLDIDTLLLENVDDLFDLQPPAAMRRGMNQNAWNSIHGSPVDGTHFFRGEVDEDAPWGQNTGINAGVMLWHPDQPTYEHMVRQVGCEDHPAHTRGNGPEQDYLSRYWADAPWTHIEVGYNFQLHQLFLALSPQQRGSPERLLYLRRGEAAAAAGAPPPRPVKLAHFSGCLKPWHRHLRADLRPLRGQAGDERFRDRMVREFTGYWLFVRKDPETWRQMVGAWDTEGFELGDDGIIYESIKTSDVDEAGNVVRRRGDSVLDDGSGERAMEMLLECCQRWEACCGRLLSALPPPLVDEIENEIARMNVTVCERCDGVLLLEGEPPIRFGPPYDRWCACCVWCFEPTISMPSKVLLSLAVSEDADGLISGRFRALSACVQGGETDKPPHQISFNMQPGVTCIEIDHAGRATGGPREFRAEGRGACCRAWGDLRSYIDGLGHSTTVAVVVAGAPAAFSSFTRCLHGCREAGHEESVWTCLDSLGLNLSSGASRRWEVEGATFVVMFGSRCVRNSRAWVAVGHVAASVERWVYVNAALDTS